MRSSVVVLVAFTAGLSLALAIPADAFSVEKNVVIETPRGPQQVPPAAKNGVVPWETLAQVNSEMFQKNGETYVRAKFEQPVAALDGTEVALQGFMFPFDQAERQSRFLLSAMPASCPFCLPAGPEQMVEVVSGKPIKFTYDAVTVKGKLQLVHESADGLLYRLTGAQQAAN